MPDSVNFVRTLRKQLSKHQQTDRRIFKYVSIISTVLFGVFVITLAIRLTLVVAVKRIQDQEAAQLAVISSQADNEKSYVIYAAKLQTLSQLFVDRRNKQQAISYFSTLFDDTVLINGIKYDAKTKSLSFGLRTKNVFTLDKTLQILNSPDVKQQFKSLTYDNLGRNNTGEYQTSVSVELKTES